MHDLRDKLIRLAYENPEMREHLLPLLKGASSDSIYDKVVMKPIGSKVTFEGESRRSLDCKQTYYYAGSMEGYGGRGILMLSKTRKGADPERPRPTHVYEGGRILPWGGGSSSRPNSYTLNHVVGVS